jgi:hypothetical protein
MYIKKVKNTEGMTNVLNYSAYIKKNGILEEPLQRIPENNSTRSALITSEDRRVIEQSDFVFEIQQRVGKRLENSHNPYSLFESTTKKVVAEFCSEYGIDPFVGQNKYNEYIAKRKGSSGVFTRVGKNANELERELSNHRGTVYLPIVSMKEDDAILAGLKLVDDWKEKTEAFVEAFAKIMKWDKAKVRYIAAYHEKELLQQRKDSVAGSQPHVHFMIWNIDTSYPRAYERMSQTELTQLRQTSASVFLSDMLEKEYYIEETDKSVVRNGFKTRTEAYFTQDLIELSIIKSRAFNHHGRATTKTVQKNIDSLTRILTRVEYRMPLSQDERDYLKRLGCTDSLRDIRVKLGEFCELQKRCFSIIDEYLNSKPINEYYQKWLSEKLEISRNWESEENAQSLNFKADQNMKSIFINTLLGYDDSWFEIQDIGKNMKKAFMERFSNYSFPKNLDDEGIIEASKRIAEILIETTDWSIEEITDRIRGVVSASQRDWTLAPDISYISRHMRESWKKPLKMQKYDFYKTFDLLNYKVNIIVPQHYVQVRLPHYPVFKDDTVHFFTTKVNNELEHKDERNYVVPRDIFK